MRRPRMLIVDPIAISLVDLMQRVRPGARIFTNHPNAVMTVEMEAAWDPVQEWLDATQEER